MKQLLVIGGLMALMAGMMGNFTAPKQGMFQEFEGVFTAVEPADLNLYRTLLPPPFEMPKQPAVALFVVHYLKVQPWPMTPYYEGTLALRCSYQGREGWHVKTMPVTKWVPNWGGRAMGFPKYVTKEITLKSSGQGWKGEVLRGGQLKLSLEYAPGLTRALTPLEEEFLKGGTPRLEEPIFLLVPPDKGPRFQQVTVTPMIPAKWQSEQGMVKITLGPDEPWSKLIPPGTISPGVFQKFTGGSNLVPKELGGK